MHFDYSLHDAWIETVAIGPRREVHLMLALGSARLSDPRLPEVATLRLGAIENFAQVSEFFASFQQDPVARIDRFTIQRQVGSSCTIILEIDPQGTVEVTCSKLELTPNVTASPCAVDSSSGVEGPGTGREG